MPAEIHLPGWQDICNLSKHDMHSVLHLSEVLNRNGLLPKHPKRVEVLEDTFVHWWMEAAFQQVLVVGAIHQQLVCSLCLAGHAKHLIKVDCVDAATYAQILILGSHVSCSQLGAL